ncbi:hypothetical protein MTO96_050439, partial [Rhipicephalus appendiculatus]
TPLLGRRGTAISTELREMHRDPGVSLVSNSAPLLDKDPSTDLSTAALGGGDPASAMRSPLEGPKRALRSGERKCS